MTVPVTALLAMQCYTGTATSLLAEKPLYQEFHQELWAKDHHVSSKVIYKDPQGKVLLEKDVTYGEFPSVPSFNARDPRSGFFEKAEVTSTAATLSYSDKKDSPENKKTIEIDGNKALVDEGFSAFIQQNWERLVGKKESIRVKFLVPSLLDAVDFDVFMDSPTEVDGHAAFLFKTRIHSYLLRLFVKSLLVTYDADTHRLLTYEGLSNVRDENGALYHARITFPQAPETCPSDSTPREQK